MPREIVVAHYSGLAGRYLRFVLDTGDHAEVTSADGPITPGFYGFVRGTLFGMFASADGPIVIVARGTAPFTKLSDHLRGADGPNADRETIRYLEFLHALLLDRDKLVADYTIASPADRPDALAWARRALAGDDDELTAAVRATELDPDFPERALIARTSGRIAPWPGLAELRRATRIAAQNVRGGATVIDLGSGVIAYRSFAGYAGVDILGKRLLWTSEEPSHYRDDLWREDDGRVLRRDPLTGEPAQVIEQPPPPHSGLPYECVVAEGRVRAEIVERGTDFDVVFHDLARGTSQRVLTGRGPHASIAALGDRVVVGFGESVHLLDATGAERWSRRDIGTVYATADDRVFAGSRPVQILDAADGRTRGELDFLGMMPDVAVYPDHLLVATFQRIAAVSRETLEVLWSRDVPLHQHFATADAFLVLRSEGSVQEASEVLAIDPRSGAIVSRIDVLRHGCSARSAALAAGKLVMLSGSAVVVVD